MLTNTRHGDERTIGTLGSNAQASNNIVAPTTGTLRGHRDLPGSPRHGGTRNKVNGGSDNVIQGAIYFPRRVLQINGSGTAVSLCAMWVAKDIVLTGNSGITISSPDDASCSGSGMPSNSVVKMVRLVA